MRAQAAILLMFCFAPACAHPRSGPEAAPDSQRTRHLPEKIVSTGAGAAEEPAVAAVLSKEVKVLGKIKGRRGGVGVRYLPPNPNELSAFAGWFRSALKATESSASPPSSAPAGFELDALDSPIWVLGERSSERRGAGAFTLRAGPATAWVIEAPHTFFDVGTLEIAVTCFEVWRARALFVNTVRRSNSQEEDMEQEERAELARSGEADSDLAHAPESFFSTAHAALVEPPAAYSVLQVHGFRDELLPSTSAVVSAAGSHATVLPIALELRKILGVDQVKTYPDEIKKLGGTRNVQARLSQASGAAFVHLELSRTLRERLKGDPAFRHEFAAALKAGALAPPGK